MVSVGRLWSRMSVEQKLDWLNPDHNDYGVLAAIFGFVGRRK